MLTYQGDLSAVDHAKKLFDTAKSHFGRVDIGINTAGLVIKKPILDVTENDYDRSFAANAKAAFFFIQQTGRKMENEGSIITHRDVAARRLYAVLQHLSGQQVAG